ncbi:CRISPR-associated RAMP protein Csx7 [Fischerella thermalis]|uniref:type III CRISPR-associated RAMP protein Csx7 n=1 Tax=Fischerella thermalis TaxID=372787 RepID=UPI000C7FB091|nr:CRISPR-associated RAMP protein Csx7 [Fischerella thermalis]PLZ05069.1 CRISPR-associated RAMP protein [Fischerella thermalis WC119]PLZ35804.1 CRISPR-associated RAMP protein [Fischerella thermalis WC558]PLZ49507.1 CRISPR-associated RAMP protein [Fischerella thermalis WC442]PLZ62389.1 CRISPR-associated RAMP protein [Fischerella thermalis WC439]PLZ71730.1 CRISPR-associated RAMP protein [Fischerella thermalis WC245]
MFDTFKNRLEITGKLSTVTALRISAGRSTEPIGADLPVIKDALEQPFIPGASFKGALRSRLESFLRGIDISLAEDPANFTSQTRNQIIKKIKEDYQDDVVLTDELLKQTDLISRLFGSPWIASKFQVRDLTVVRDTWFGQYQERDGVAIDRDTETAAEKKLYDFQVVPSGTSFDLKIVVENAESWELGLLMIGLHQFESEQIPLGGGRSRGLGVVSLKIEQMQWFDTEGDAKKLLNYLQNQVTGNMSNYQYGEEEIEILKQEWTQALIWHLRSLIPGISLTQTTTEEI